jgi:hypothetical protein
MGITIRLTNSLATFWIVGWITLYSIVGTVAYFTQPIHHNISFIISLHLASLIAEARTLGLLHTHVCQGVEYTSRRTPAAWLITGVLATVVSWVLVHVSTGEFVAVSTVAPHLATTATVCV